MSPRDPHATARRCRGRGNDCRSEWWRGSPGWQRRHIQTKAQQVLSPPSRCGTHTRGKCATHQPCQHAGRVPRLAQGPRGQHLDAHRGGEARHAQGCGVVGVRDAGGGARAPCPAHPPKHSRARGGLARLHGIRLQGSGAHVIGHNHSGAEVGCGGGSAAHDTGGVPSAAATGGGAVGPGQGLSNKSDWLA